MSRLSTKPVVVAIVALAIFAIAQQSRQWVYGMDWYRDALSSLPQVVQWLEQPVRWLILCLIGIAIVHRLPPWKAFRELGLYAPVHVGIGFGLLATLPMLVLCLFWGRFDEGYFSLLRFFGVVIWPLGEEILFRGYAFRQLHRRAGWNLWAAAVVTGVVFGAVHLLNVNVQQTSFSEQLGTVAVISVSGILFAWVFAKWEDNLWVPLALHGFGNLWWSVELTADPLGGWGAMVSRVLTLVLVIVLTIYRKKVLALVRITPATD